MNNFRNIFRAALLKRAAAILTPEAEQAAMQPPMDPAAAQGGAPGPQGGMPPQGMPPQQDPMAGAPMPPQGGAPMPPEGQLPPEILQDQNFIAWLQQQGVQFDPNSMQFFDPNGQPLPPDVIMQAYDAYMQEMQGGQQGVPPQQGPMAGAPMPPQGGELPPEIMQDQMFIQFLQETFGIQLDPNTQQFVAPDGSPVPSEIVAQTYQQFIQQSQGQAPGQAGEAGALETPEQPAQAPEAMQQMQDIVNSAIESYTAQIDKKIETLLDKMETIKMALEAMRDTDDKRTAQDEKEQRQLQEDLAAELAPTTKQASAQSQKKTASAGLNAPVNMFNILMRK